MAYGDFAAQIKERGAVAIVRSQVDKTTSFEYQGCIWQVSDKNRATMRDELADGYEMSYCLKLYCEAVVSL